MENKENIEQKQALFFVESMELSLAHFCKNMNQESKQLLNLITSICDLLAKKHFSITLVQLQKIYEYFFTFGQKLSTEIIHSSNNVLDMFQNFNTLISKRKEYLFCILEIESILANYLIYTKKQDLNDFSDFSSVISALSENFPLTRKQNILNTFYKLLRKRNNEVHLTFLKNDIDDYDKMLVSIKQFKNDLHNLLTRQINLHNANISALNDQEREIFADFLHFDANNFTKASDTLSLFNSQHKKIAGLDFVNKVWKQFNLWVSFSNKEYNETLFKTSFIYTRNFTLSPFNLWVQQSSKISLKNSSKIDLYTKTNTDEILNLICKKANITLDNLHINYKKAISELIKKLTFHPDLTLVIEFLWKSAKKEKSELNMDSNLFLVNKDDKTIDPVINTFLLYVWRVLSIFALFNYFTSFINTLLYVHTNHVNINDLFPKNPFNELCQKYYHIVSHILTFRNPNLVLYTSSGFFTSCLYLADLISGVYSSKFTNKNNIKITLVDQLGYLLYLAKKTNQKLDEKTTLKQFYDVLTLTKSKEETDLKHLNILSMNYEKLVKTDMSYLYQTNVSPNLVIKQTNKLGLITEGETKHKEKQTKIQKQDVKIINGSSLQFAKEQIMCPCVILNTETKAVFMQFKYLSIDFKLFDNKNIDGWVKQIANKMINQEEKKLEENLINDTKNGTNILYSIDEKIQTKYDTLFIDKNNNTSLLSKAQEQHLINLYENINVNNHWFKVSFANFIKLETETISTLFCFESFYANLLFKILLLNKLKDKLNNDNYHLFQVWFTKTYGELDLNQLFNLVNSLYQWKK